MCFSPRLTAFVLTCILLAPAPGRGDEIDASMKAGTKLLEEGDRLADEGKPGEAVIRYKSAFEQLLPRLRKIPFKHEVKRDVTKREQLKAMLVKEFEEDQTPEEFRANEMAMKALGLVPRSLDLKSLLVQVYSEEIAAFYDPKTKTMHLIEELEAKTKAKPTLLERLFGKTGGFDKDENKTVIAHELTHALSDQHYDLDKLQKDAKHDDDRGAGSFGPDRRRGHPGHDGRRDGRLGRFQDRQDARRRPRSRSEHDQPVHLDDWRRQDPAFGAPIVSESMVFPYFRGMVFCAALVNDGGWKSVDEAYKSPPVSTEQIIHPEKYRSKLDLPMCIDLRAEAGRTLEGAGAERARRAADLDHAGASGPQGRGRLGWRPLRGIRGPRGEARPGLAVDLGRRG